ncbi:MAG: hypothetical protein EP343_16885 [Deltaproteobacteria bacterium]|nr:MAG: hypothetical protein EP343_16885 [Deltaproteobacteria bacterium]
MIYTLEVIGIGQTFRLQQDNTWRLLEQRMHLQPGDYFSEEPEGVLFRSAAKKRLEQDLPLEESGDNPFFSARNMVTFSSRVLRRKFPALPDMEQLTKTIREGNDHVNNSLILNSHGAFELRPRPPYNPSLNDPSVAVRNETFGAGNGYVGREPASDFSFMMTLYSNLLDYWVLHLATGQTNLYVDSYANKSMEVLMKELDDVEARFEPWYKEMYQV